MHGDGLDELTTTGETEVAEWRDGDIRLFRVTPEAVGLPRARIEDLKGGAPEANAKALRRVLGGQSGPYRDMVLLNAAAALLVADRVETLSAGAEMAAETIDAGLAAQALERLVAVTNA